MIKEKGGHTMLTKKQLIDKFSEMNINCYEVLSDINEETAFRLTNFEQLCLFANNHNIDAVFYRFEYASAEDLEITDSLLDELEMDLEIRTVMRFDFEKYNNDVRKLDFGRPHMLSVFCLYQGHIIYIKELDYWYRDIGYYHPQTMVWSLIENNTMLKMVRESRREELRRRILADPQFHECADENMMRHYAVLLNNSDESVRKLFFAPGFGCYDITAIEFVENIWHEYKVD